MVHLAEERERLLPTSEETDPVPNGSTNGARSHDTKVAKVKQCIAKNGIAAFAATLVAVGIVVFGAVVLTNKKVGAPETALCMTPACVHAAASILDSLSSNDKVKPCDNFEEFVCGEWKDQHDMRADQREMNEMSLIDERSTAILRHVLEGEYSVNIDQSNPSLSAASSIASLDKANFNKLKDGYIACMDESLIAQRGLQPLLKLVNELKDTYPLAESSEAIEKPKKPEGSTEGVTDAIAYLQELGVAGFIDFGISADDRDPDSQVLSLQGPRRIGLRSKEEYKDDKVVAKYTFTISAMFKIIAQKEGLDASEALSEGVVALEKKLSQISMDEEDANDPLHYYNPHTLAEVKAFSPVIDVEAIIKRFSPNYIPSRLIVTSPEYIEKVNVIIQDTPRDVVQAYFIWKLVYGLSSKVDQASVTPIVELKDMLQGTKAQPERWRTCVRTMDQDLGWILGRFFIEKAFSEEAKTFGDRIIYDIKYQFSETLGKLDWFDSEAAKLAIQKVENIVQKIGYPDQSPNITSPASLHEYYAGVTISADTFFENALSVTKTFNRKAWEKLSEPTDRAEWDMTPPTVNAYYNPPGNEIVFPAGIMQFPIFSLDVPEYISYGAFAAVAGHELSHAFDSTGRHYDINGNLTDWWPQATVDEFEKRAQCFVEQYSEFAIEAPSGEKIHVNGKLTLGENIADAGGLNAAFSAWKKRDAQNPSPELPGLQGRLTKEQLFFVSYARTWCSKIRKEAAVDRVRTDPHSPAWVRVLGTTANALAFLEAFNCPVKKPRCELW
ncbi:peptidase family M13 [Tirmania nivea]|nr:peptidase family M13 [Tirmania nivea]